MSKTVDLHNLIHDELTPLLQSRCFTADESRYQEKESTEESRFNLEQTVQVGSLDLQVRAGILNSRTGLTVIPVLTGQHVKTLKNEGKKLFLCESVEIYEFEGVVYPLRIFKGEYSLVEKSMEVEFTSMCNDILQEDGGDELLAQLYHTLRNTK